ncbi:hypothetical protein ACIA5D_36730 [Actinoplanes sp. NPDC051513]|uniref:hypothetical protein n=1 Tax=Actinoplanes sp. NPDC051513 TaxID=3363908 RepID=UPI0037A68526
MSVGDRLMPGRWVRWLATDNPNAPLAQWRYLLEVREVGWPRWQVVLRFADGLEMPFHRGNLALTDEHGHPLWGTSATKPE